MAARRQTGFTLIELMSAVIVLAILAAIATPSYIEYLERSRLKGAVEETLTLLAQARQGAVEADRNVNVRLTATASAWCAGAIEQTSPAAADDPVAIDPAACDCSNPATCVVGGEELVVSSAGRDVTVPAGTTTVVFDSKSGTLTPLGTRAVDFLSSSGRYGLRVRVSALGQARACIIPGKRFVAGYNEC